MAVSHLVIIAGGAGTRLARVIGDIPKALCPVGGKPVLQYQLELAARYGVTDVTIMAGVMADQIEAFLGDGARFGLRIQVIAEGEPLGNAGLTIQSLDQLPDQVFLLYGDVMLAVDLARMGKAHLAAEADFTTFTHPNDHPFDSDLVEVDETGAVTALLNSPHPDGAYYENNVNAALYVVRTAALLPWTDHQGKLDFTKDIMPALIARGAKVMAYPSDEYIKDMGTPERLVKVTTDLAAGKISVEAAQSSRPAVFLDRDGTLNVERGHLNSPDQLELLPGVGEALKALRGAGYRLIVVTNQPVIARGEATEATIAAVHRKLGWELGKAHAYLDAVYLCPHHPDAGFLGERPELKIACDCRKPGRGMIDQACRDWAIDLDRSWVVGDQTRDIALAKAVGLKSVLVRTGAGGADGFYDVQPDFVADNLAVAANIILQQAAAA